MVVFAPSATRLGPDMGDDWERRMAGVWATIDEREPADFVAAVDELAALRDADDPDAIFEQGAARDSTGHSDQAVALRRALELGLGGERRRRAVIQMASSLRNLGRAEESVGCCAPSARPGRTSSTTRSAPSWPSRSSTPAASARRRRSRSRRSRRTCRATSARWGTTRASCAARNYRRIPRRRRPWAAVSVASTATASR